MPVCTVLDIGYIPDGLMKTKVNRNNAYHTPLSGSYLFSYNYDRELTALTFPSEKQILYTYENTLLKQIHLAILRGRC